MTKTCPDCGYKMPLAALISGSGVFYIGYTCPDCGPYQRVSQEYFKSLADAEEALRTGNYTRKEFP